jgi:hypothetical protein
MSKQAFKRVRRELGMEVSRKPLDAYAWPGGYPIAYMTIEGDTLCPDCVNAEIDLISAAKQDNDKQWWVRSQFIHWEGDPEICCHCGKPIESAYGPVEV